MIRGQPGTDGTGRQTVITQATHAINAALERRFPEKRLFLRTDADTRFVRLKPLHQLVAWVGVSMVVGWAIVATAIILMDSIGAGNFRAQAQRDQLIYEDRLSALAAERDLRAGEAIAAHERFSAALEQISQMQSALLASEDRRRELETGIEVIQSTLRRTMGERDSARDERAALLASVEGGGALPGAASEMTDTVDLLSAALADTAAERDTLAVDAEAAIARAADMQLELELLEEKNDEIFRQLEEAMLVSVEPIEKMFRNAGMDPDRLLREVRRGYSGTGGPLTPVTFSTRGAASDAQTERANAILQQMDQINLYRIAAERAPFDIPVKSGYRMTSGFGPRWGRMHNGLDFAAAIGTPIYAPADGVVTFAGWSSGYGRLVKVQHAFGIETRYAHQSRIRVEVGQRVSRGDRIGDIGNSGRSTGPHLHYEVRVGGTPVNPMTYIRAGQDVF